MWFSGTFFINTTTYKDFVGIFIYFPVCCHTYVQYIVTSTNSGVVSCSTFIMHMLTTDGITNLNSTFLIVVVSLPVTSILHSSITWYLDY